MTLDTDLSTFNVTAVRMELALLFGVPVAYIQLNATGGSVVVSVQIVVPASAAASAPLASLAERVESTNTSAIAQQLGMDVTQKGAVQTSNRTYVTTSQKSELVQIGCYPGHWCTGGKAIPCEKDTYNADANGSLGRDCKPCQQHSHTYSTATIFPWQCNCRPSFTRREIGSPQDTPAECVCAAGSQIRTEIIGGIGVASCGMCEVGFYKSDAGNDYCTRCPDFTTTISNGAMSVHECVCAINHFLNGDADGIENGTIGTERCERCETATIDGQPIRTGTDCSQAGITLLTLPLKHGYWRVDHRLFRPVTARVPSWYSGVYVSDTIHPCFNPMACEGTNNRSSELDVGYKASNVSNPCRIGHRGVFCAACQWPNYKLNGDTGLCERCDGSRELTVITPLVGVVFAILLLIGSMASGGKGGGRQRRNASLKRMLTSKYSKALLSNAATAVNDGGVEAAANMVKENVTKEIDKATKPTPAEIQAAAQNMKGAIERKLPEPLTWADVQPAIELIDSIEELQAAIKAPEAFLKALIEQTIGPVAIRIAVKRLKPVVEPKLPVPLTWADVQPAIELIDSIEELPRRGRGTDGLPGEAGQ